MRAWFEHTHASRGAACYEVMRCVAFGMCVLCCDVEPNRELTIEYLHGISAGDGRHPNGGRARGQLY